MKRRKNKAQREKLRAFECGFEPEHKIRNSFSLRFFTLTVVFLIFDVEVAILFPLPLANESLNFTQIITQGTVLFALLRGGLLFE
jgi:NADH-ubiquinone oxidoreductase chain 3